MIQNTLITAASFTPNSLQVPNAWVGHLPFAAWVIREISPKIFVELGTHSGNSYFAFCQAVVEAGLSTKCYAVDTWQGDEHAGRYQDDIFACVNAHHQENYVGFSRLLRMTFDDAATYFANESIDLLHIDGLHTYEAVRHDFETWLPKLAPGAVVMFHDTNVRERSFGVWKLWQELQARYPYNLEFVHSNGLGVLQLNDAPDQKRLGWLQPGSSENPQLIGYFAALGSRQLDRYVLNDLKTHVENLNKTITQREGRIASLTQAIVESDRQIANHIEVAAVRDGRMTELNAALDDSERRISALYESTSWRMTTPFRKFLGRTSLIRLIVRRTIKLVWWTATLQLPKRANEWRAFRRARGAGEPHISPPKTGLCFAIPFEYPIKKITDIPKVAVICHLFYPEMLEEIKLYLQNIPFSFDLIITTDTDEKKHEIRNKLLQWEKGSVDIRIAANRGRDIAPKLITCHDIYERYEFFLHIHSKKSPHLEMLEDWREYLLENLLGSKEIVKCIFEAFLLDPKLGIIAPEHFGPVRDVVGWGWNFDLAQKFSNRLAIELSLDGKIDFPSGSMFWGRSAALKPLLASGLTIEDFPKETGQFDGTLGHVIERLYFFVCEKAGYRWIKVAQPHLLRKLEKVLLINDQVLLLNSIIKYQYGLLPSSRELTSVNLELGINDGSVDEPIDSYLRRVHAQSDLHNIDFFHFREELKKHIAKKESAIDFDEEFYLAANPDVCDEVTNGHIACGYVHYCMDGKNERRIYSDTQIRRRFLVTPNYPKGFLEPVGHRPFASSLNLSALPQSNQPTLVMLVPHLQDDLFFAGYSEFFKDYVTIFEKFDRVILGVESNEFDEKIALRYSNRIEVMHLSNIELLEFKPTLVVCFNAHLTCLAHDMLSDDSGRIVYYCQDFEAGFFPYGTDYLICERAIASSQNLVISTEPLKQFFITKGLVKDQNLYVTQPKVEIFSVQPIKNQRLFFYYRPESFNKRNLSEAIWQAVHDFCNKYSGYEIFLVGSVSTSYSFKIYGTQVYVLNKLAKKDYVDLISSCDVVVSMIYSAHPGVIAFQAAASGIPTITNVFENRDFSFLRKISSNILPYDPIRHNLLESIEQALIMPKGNPSFDASMYSGKSQGSFIDFHVNLIASAGEAHF